jgi:hypothetical protein
VSTKTPSTSKAKKPAGKVGRPAKAKVAPEDEAKKKKAKAAKPGGAREEGEGEGEGDEDEDDEEEFLPKKSGKPAAEPTAVVPARRLTPEAKAAINAMVAKGVPLDEALRRAGSWETFVAPVKDETQKAFPGKEGGGPRSPFGGRRPSGPRDKSEVPPREPGGFGFDEDDAGVSLSDDEPIVAGGDDD